MHRIVLAGALLIALIVPLTANANSIPTTGQRIDTLHPPTTYPANTPFYVEQGFGCYLNESETCANAGTEFVLWVHGVQQPSQKDVDTFDLNGVTILHVSYLTNFPQGLGAGTHTFTGIWYLNGSFFDEHTASVTFT
jgi:hypothetical protein